MYPPAGHVDPPVGLSQKADPFVGKAKKPINQNEFFNSSPAH